MYIQVTDKCNMTCAHCCFACTGKGTFMSQAVFDKAIEVAASHGEFVTIGGGEPTLHPKILDWVMQASLALVDVSMDVGGPAVLIITNGKKSKTAETLAKLTRLGVISAELSQDKFHDPIEERTVDIFERYAKIRNVTGEYGDLPVIDAGRASDNVSHLRSGCACDTLFITPNGDFYGCGCKSKKLGNILTDDLPPSYWENHDQCHRELETA